MKTNPKENSLCAQMAIALQLIKRKNQQAITSAGYIITMEQIAVLEILNVHGDMNMTELSHAVWKQNATITRIVDKLEKRQFVIRKAVKGDRRANLLSITDKGRQVFNKILPIINDVYNNADSDISKEEEAITLKTLKKLINHLSEN